MAWGDNDLFSQMLRREIDEALPKFCNRCGRFNDLTIHHIKPQCTHPELVFEITNCERLCEDCHDEEHESKDGIGKVGICPDCKGKVIRKKFRNRLGFCKKCKDYYDMKLIKKW